MPRVLIVEDDPDLRQLYHTVLTHEGYDVTMAESSAHALLALTNGPFDLLILDIAMPGGNGTHVIQFARDDIRLRNIPIVVVSANERWEHPVRELGVKHFYVKPMSIHRLIEITHDLVGPANGGEGA